MFRKIVTTIIVVPLAAVLVAFAVANRQAVTVSFDPFSATAPAYAATLPLFAVIFAVLILGVLVGGFAAWLGQGKWRRNARRLDAELRSLRQEMELRNARDGYRSPAPSPTEPTPLPIIAPPGP
ncbi:MAG: LapA family protein [Rhizobiales bacterium]|nr:LapA family protein [Hyphomicrobiales bacterium]